MAILIVIFDGEVPQTLAKDRLLHAVRVGGAGNAAIRSRHGFVSYEHVARRAGGDAIHAVGGAAPDGASGVDGRKGAVFTNSTRWARLALVLHRIDHVCVWYVYVCVCVRLCVCVYECMRLCFNACLLVFLYPKNIHAHCFCWQGLQVHKRLPRPPSIWRRLHPGTHGLQVPIKAFCSIAHSGGASTPELRLTCTSVWSQTTQQGNRFRCAGNQ